MSIALSFVLCLVAADTSPVERGARLLAEFQPEEAARVLSEAARKGPFRRQEYVRLYEQLGIAYAYLDQPDDALRAFDMLLALDPGRAISYTLSPKVTFLFERARATASERAAPTIDIRWPPGLRVGDHIPLDVEVVADPKGFLATAELRVRLKGTTKYSRANFELLRPGQSQRVDLPPANPLAAAPGTLELFLVARDARGNEVYNLGSESRPREIALRYETPDPWFRRWWVWAIAGTVAAAGAGAAVFAVTRDPGPSVDGTLRVVP